MALRRSRVRISLGPPDKASFIDAFLFKRAPPPGSLETRLNNLSPRLEARSVDDTIAKELFNMEEE